MYCDVYFSFRLQYVAAGREIPGWGKNTRRAATEKSKGGDRRIFGRQNYKLELPLSHVTSAVIHLPRPIDTHTHKRWAPDASASVPVIGTTNVALTKSRIFTNDGF